MGIDVWQKRAGALLIIVGMAMPQISWSQDADSVKSLCAQLTDLSPYARENICPSTIESWQQNHEATIPNELTRLWSPEELQKDEQEFWLSLHQCSTSACIQDAYAKKQANQLDVANKLVEQERLKLEAQAEKQQQETERRRLETQAQQHLADEQRPIAGDQPKTVKTNSAANTPAPSESTTEPNSNWGLLAIGIIVLPIFLIAGFCWQYVINTFIGPSKRIGYWPCILISFIPVIGQLVFPLAFICFVIRMLRGSVKSVV